MLAKKGRRGTNDGADRNVLSVLRVLALENLIGSADK